MEAKEGSMTARSEYLRERLPDHVGATIEMLDAVIEALERGKPPEELGYQVQLIGRMMERRT